MRAKVELVDVRGVDTEDVMGADTLYVVGGATDGVTTKAVLTTPVWISRGETKAFAAGEAVLFDDEVAPGRSVQVALQVYDEDAAKDWAKHREWVTRVSEAVAASLQEAAAQEPGRGGGQEGVDPRLVVAAVLRGTVTAVGFFASRDKDDLLGTLTLHLPTLAPYQELRELTVRGRWASGLLGWSTWDHRLRVRVTVTGTPAALVVRTGAVLTLGHVATAGQLHSHPFAYGHSGGSGQQQVTVFTGSDENDLWRVRPADGSADEDGRPLQHGDVLRLTHVATGRNLHSHAGLVSPVTRQQEVTCFGEDGEGDPNDDWRLEVDGGGAWEPSRRVRLVHVATAAALHSHAGARHARWTRGQQEVTGFEGRDDNDWWQVRGLR